MPHTCRVCSRTNPDGAAYCYFDGRPLLKDLDHGPVRVGGLPFPTPFYFSDGKPCANFNELALGCDTHWEEARAVLTEGMWPMFFGGIGRFDLAAAARQAAAEPDPDLGLCQLVEKFPADPDFLRPPRLALDCDEEDLGQIAPGADRRFELVIGNQGMLLLHGVIWTDCEWLAFDDRGGPSMKMFQARKSCTVTAYALGSRLRSGMMPWTAEVYIDTNGGARVVPVRVRVPVRPFPAGVHANDSLAGACSPREIAVKAKAALDRAAVLFEQGAVKAWYEENGWTYPIEGSEGLGKGAVQQFFEALGLTRPPRLEVRTKALTFKGQPGERLRGTITVGTDEPKPVYARAWADQRWVGIDRVRYLGNKVRIRVEVAVPDLPGANLLAQVTVEGNGKQTFVVPVGLAVEPPAPRSKISGLFQRWGGKPPGP